MATNPPERIHLVFKTHLDLGFTALAEEVTTQYFTTFIPHALQTARQLRERESADRFIWTTGSWLIYEYLEQAAPRERQLMEEAIAAGDLSWHGLPFTTHSELMDASLFTYGLTLSHELDHRFGKKTIAAKMTDVPGHTRGIVPLLAAAGITFLHIGVNPATTAPAVPPVFVWRDSSDAEVTVMYQHGSYGDFVQVPGSTVALAFAHTNDNLGPQSPEAIHAIYRKLRMAHPQAQISASTLDAFALELPALKETLPVITGEIGDTWIHGVGTDPQKVSQFRELLRLRRQWLGNGRLAADAERTRRFSHALLPVAEHTWGLDEKTHLDDYTHYLPAQLQTLRTTSAAQHFASSWTEQRNYLRHALAALGDSPEGQEAQAHLRNLEVRPREQDTWQPVQDWHQTFETAHFTLGFDATGALHTLKERTTGRAWASTEQVLGRVRYELFSQQEYDRFWRQYVVANEETIPWASKDFNKPGIDLYLTHYQAWHPRVVAVYERHDEQEDAFFLEMRLPEDGVALGAPRRFTVELRAPHAAPSIIVNLQWMEKAASRLPEALWYSFQPIISDPTGWSFTKLGTRISPLEVISRGNRTLHAIDQTVVYEENKGTLLIETLDAPLIAPGKPALLDFADELPDMAGGVHCNLYNNVWGTNFPMWYEQDARFRFVIRCNTTE